MNDEEVFCPQCGAAYPPESKACTADGERLFPATVAARVGQQIDAYTLVSVLGEGAMSHVYRGEHAALLRPVAIKILREEWASQQLAADRFLQEARALGRLKHPNIVEVSDCGIAPDGAVYFVMELLEGESLEDSLQRCTRFRLFEAVGIIRQIASALEAAHDSGIVHRDLKPANIFLSTRTGNRRYLRQREGGITIEYERTYEQVKLLDFGVAKVQQTVGPTTTAAGMVMGTPAYMAPEQARGQPVDARTDIYALGVLFYELLTGSVPFRGDSMLDVLNSHVHEQVEPPLQRCPEADIDEQTAKTILTCLAKDPADRYQDVGEVQTALLDCHTDRIRVRDARALMKQQHSQLTQELASLFATESAAEQKPTTSPPARKARSLTEELAELFRKK